MSTSSSLSLLAFASEQVVIYIGIFLLVAGLIGGPLILTVFLSLRTFRESSCAFYLTVMSLVNFCHLFTGLLTFIMINGFGISWISASLFYCKFRNFNLHFFVSISFTCMCFATVDQFLATCSHPRWHRWSNIKIARYMVTGSAIFWIMPGIPFLIYYNHKLSSITGEISCVITNGYLQQYQNSSVLPVLTSSLPIAIMMLFGILAYRNVQKLAYRTVPLVRRELDKQLTTMVLIQVFCNVLVIIPTILQSITFLIINPPNDSLTTQQFSLINTVTTIFYYFYFADPFYIYMRVSKRFRQQLTHVLFTAHLNRWHPRNIINNQVNPRM